MPAPTDPSSPSPASAEAPGAALPSEPPSGAAERSPWRLRPQFGRHPLRFDSIFFGIAAGWVIFDQIAKVIVRETLAPGEHERLAAFFRFSHIQNDGGAFGLFGGANSFLAVSAAIAIAVVLVYYLFPPVEHWLARAGLALILGGAVGNLLDRIYQGHVTDFVNFNEFPAFNVADAGINIGVVAIVIALIWEDARRRPRPG